MLGRQYKCIVTKGGGGGGGSLVTEQLDRGEHMDLLREGNTEKKEPEPLDQAHPEGHPALNIQLCQYISLLFNLIRVRFSVLAAQSTPPGAAKRQNSNIGLSEQCLATDSTVQISTIMPHYIPGTSMSNEIAAK